MAAYFLILGIVIIACNIGLMFVHEGQPTERQEAQRRTDEIIQSKLGSSNFLTKSAAWISGTIAGPIISFLKKMDLKLLGYFRFCIFFLKLEKLFLDECL